MIFQLVLLSTLTVTAYQPVPAQTREGCKGIHDCFTSVGDVPTKYGVAVSQDLLKSGQVKYGEPLYIEGIGWRIINDTMNVRHRNHVDVMVWSHDAEREIGTRHLRVYRMQKSKGEPK